jgi:hypothetical protein
MITTRMIFLTTLVSALYISLSAVAQEQKIDSATIVQEFLRNRVGGISNSNYLSKRINQAQRGGAPLVIGPCDTVVCSVDIIVTDKPSRNNEGKMECPVKIVPDILLVFGRNRSIQWNIEYNNNGQIRHHYQKKFKMIGANVGSKTADDFHNDQTLTPSSGHITRLTWTDRNPVSRSPIGFNYDFVLQWDENGDGNYEEDCIPIDPAVVNFG